MNIGKKIKKYRKEAGLTQKQLAEKIGRKEITIRKYESGEREPRISIINDICEALNLPIDEFGEELFEIKRRGEERLEEIRQQPFNSFNEYESNPVKKSMTQYKLINDLLLVYGYKIEYYNTGGSIGKLATKEDIKKVEERAEEYAEAMSNNIIPSAKVINLKTKEEFEIMLKDITNLFDNCENFFAFEMFKLQNRNDK